MKKQKFFRKPTKSDWWEALLLLLIILFFLITPFVMAHQGLDFGKVLTKIVFLLIFGGLFISLVVLGIGLLLALIGRILR